MQLQTELSGTSNQLSITQAALQNQASTAGRHNLPKTKRPVSYKGKGSVESWITHITQITNYVIGMPDEQALTIAANYLEGPVHI